MVIDKNESVRRHEALRSRDGELGLLAEKLADTYRGQGNSVGEPYAFPPIAPSFYPSFIYVDPSLTHQQGKSRVTVLDHENFRIFVPKNCVLPTNLADILEKMGEADFAYADSFHFDPDDPSQFTHQLRPGWSPERLRGHCYVGDVVIATKKLVRRAGGKKFLASISSHNRALRLSELAKSPTHLSALLYGSSIDDRVPMVDIDAVRSHCARTGIDAEVSDCAEGAAVKVIRTRTGTPSICAIMPTRGTSAEIFGEQVVLATYSIRVFRELSTYGDIEFVVVADSDTPAGAIEEITRAAGNNVRFLPFNKPFNFAEKINTAAVQTNADYLLFVNDDSAIITPDIIEIMLSYFEDPTVGMVGPMLRYEDNTIQSAGHLLNPIPFDLYRGCELRSDAAFGMLNVAREVSSVIAAFSIVPRKVFEVAGGLSEFFPADYNDIDFSLKLDMLGYRTIFTPHAECFHFESKTRTPGQNPDAVALLGKRWQHEIENDQYANRYLEPYQTVWKASHDSQWSLREAMGTDLGTP
jgi:GT2 family glycosyltransferase